MQQSMFSPDMLPFGRERVLAMARKQNASLFRAASTYDGVPRMSIRVLALALLASVSLAHAAPPDSAPSSADDETKAAPETIDVDAMARAKDAAAATPAPADAPPSSAQDAAPPAAARATVPPPQAPPLEAPPSDSAMPAPASAPETAHATEKPLAAPPAEPALPEDAVEKSIAAGCRSRAASLLDDAEKADYGNATRDFDAKMRTSMPAPKFKQQWESLAQFGKLVARGQSHVGKGEGYTIVMIPLIFEKTNLVAQIACGTDGRIAGFHVTQAPKPKPAF